MSDPRQFADNDARPNIAGQFCGQGQPHDAHNWQTPLDYARVTFIQHYQCAGLSACVIPPETTEP
jgi:hypothetical protein